MTGIKMKREGYVRALERGRTDRWGSTGAGGHWQRGKKREIRRKGGSDGGKLRVTARMNASVAAMTFSGRNNPQDKIGV